jgi:polysaccharide deacetylase family protein (PEP-CTERM system associated)
MLPGACHDAASTLPRARPAPLVNALTVDVEDYYHVSAFEGFIDRADWDAYPSRIEASTHTILDVLARAGVQATFFVLGWVAERYPRLVEAIDEAGHEVACHSYWHRLVYRQTPAEFRDDLCRARDVLQDIVGKRITAYRAPSFSLTRRSLWAWDVLLEEGFTADSSVYPTFHDRYGLPGAPLGPHRIERPAGVLWELPMAVHRKWGYPLPVGGGGYFRLYPYPLTRRWLRAINAQGRPFVAYVHPWEVDPDQPRLPAPWKTRLRHYLGLRRTGRRLARLVRDFRFGTVADVVRQAEEQASPEEGLRRAA